MAAAAPLASFEPLTPTSFLRRAALTHGTRVAVVDGSLTLTYEDLWERARRLAGALVALEAGDGERVAVLSANSHVMLEAHYGVPLAGGVLVALNIRLSAREIGYILSHSGARLVLCDTDLAPLAKASVAAAGADTRVIREGDEYERLLAAAEPIERPVTDERGVIAINYTSGTTGTPKGVMYHHRGAYLQSLAMVVHSQLQSESKFLWTLPMFHCNGWCFTWAVTAAASTHVCLRKADPAEIWRLIATEGITHFNGAPTVLASLAYHSSARPRTASPPIQVATGGAPPSPTLLARLDDLGMEVTHLYGLTESYGPAIICDWKPEWDALPDDRRARLKARQGVPNLIAQPIRVVDIDGRDVPHDGAAMGEVLLRGNDVMLGYYRDDEATRQATLDGWLRTGDLGVIHPDGYLELRDRSKDVIISGGENISSVEVEQALVSHPSVLEAAVIPVPDEKWGERPAAYVVLKEGGEATASELQSHVGAQIARFKIPDRIEFRDELPKTSTGKIQKFRLREEAGGR